MKAIVTIISTVVGFLVLLAAFSLLVAYPTKWLMNYMFAPEALVAMFGAAKLTVWKAWALNCLIGGLFKSSYSNGKS